MRLLLALVCLFSASAAFAVDGNILFNGTVASSCSFSSSSAGVVDVTGTAFTSTTDGTITVVNNDPGTFTLSLGALTLPTSPDSQGISSSTSTPSVTGDNVGITLPATLTNAGTDVVSVSISGTLDATATAGTYIFQQVVSCV